MIRGIVRRGVAHAPAATAGAAPRPLHNTALLTVASLAAKGCSFLLLLVATRRLGRGGFGDYNQVMAFVGLFAVATDLGLSTLAVREIAQDRARLPRYVGNVLLLRLLLALLVAAACIALSVALGYSASVRTGIVLWALSLVPGALVGAAGIVFQGIERMAPLSALTAATAALTALLGIMALLLGGRVVAVIGVAAGVNAASGIAALALAARVAPLRPRLELRWWPGLLRAALPFATLALLNVLYSNADQVIVYTMKGRADAGLYGIAYRFVTILLVVLITPFNAAALPAFNRIAAGSRTALQRLVLSGLRITLMLGVPVAIAGSLYAREILRFVGGNTYLPAVPALQWLAWSFPCFTVLAILYNALYAVGRANALGAIFGLTLVFNVGLNLLLVPHYSFYASAALTTCSEALNVVLAAYAVWRSLVNPLVVWPAVVKVVVAAAVLAAIMLLLRPLPVVAGLPLGVVAGLLLGAPAYLAAIHLLRVFGPPEQAALSRLPLAGRYARLL